jgi:predicted permease
MDINSAVKQGGMQVSGTRFLLAKALLVSQVAMSVVLLMGTGLLIRTISKWQNVDPGFNTENLLLFSVRPEALQYDAGRIAALYEAMSERIGAIPGVHAVTRSDYPLVSGQGTGRARIRALGDGAQSTFAHVRSVQFNFLETMGIPLLAGRNLFPSDNQSSNRVAVISETTARRLFPSRNPVGERFVFIGSERLETEDIEVVGVAKDVQASAESDTLGIVFLSASQSVRLGGLTTGTHFEIRTARDPFILVPAIREAIREIDPNLPVNGIRTQDQEVSRGSSRARTLIPIWSIFGAVAALLTCIGLFGLMSYNVTRRTNEIGIRIAFGAGRFHVVRLVMGQMLLLVTIGIAIGLAGSLIANQALRTSIFGVTLYDPVTIVAVLVMLFGVTAVAGYYPVRRASRVDPTVALRYE